MLRNLMAVPKTTVSALARSAKMLPGARCRGQRGTSAAPPIVADMGILEYKGKAWNDDRSFRAAR